MAYTSPNRLKLGQSPVFGHNFTKLRIDQESKKCCKLCQSLACYHYRFSKHLILTDIESHAQRHKKIVFYCNVHTYLNILFIYLFFKY